MPTAMTTRDYRFFLSNSILLPFYREKLRELKPPLMLEISPAVGFGATSPVEEGCSMGR
jgi:hypothetical protein